MHHTTATTRCLSTSNLPKPPDTFFDYLKESYDQGQLTNNGPCVRQLEKRLAELHGVDHCIAICSGFWAIALVLKTIADEGEVVLPAMTYRRLADIVAWCGLTPHFCDIGSDLAATVETIIPAINTNTRALLIAQPIVKRLDMDSIEQLQGIYDIPIVFDSVEVGMGSCQGRMIGS